MRRRLVIICCVAGLLCVTACSGSAPDQTGQKAEQETGSIFENDVRFYMMEADADTTVTPAIELDGTDGTFMFLGDVLLSANTQGTFTVSDNMVTAKSDDGKTTYLFEVVSGESLRFVQEGSSKVMLSDAENNEKYLADKAEFTIVDKMPAKEEVYAMRRKVLDGMSEEDKKTLTDNIKTANESFERQYVYDNLADRLSDPEAPEWDTLEETYDTDTLIMIVQEMKDSLKNDLLRDDLESIIQNIYQAKETRDVECVKQIYYTVHDMDYFLLRYGIEDVGKHIPDMSAVSTYYGALEVYKK